MPAEGSAALFERPGFVRLTASDRPGVAQPVPERDVPPQPWLRIVGFAFAGFLALLAAWEWHWRAFGREPGHRNSDGAWAEQRRRIDHGEGDATVLIGSSRVFFDVQLPVWERVTGERPIQLALEGTSPIPILEDLAADPAFTGKLVVGVAPVLFFTGASRRVGVLRHYHDRGPSQRTGYWLSRDLLEPVFAFYDTDFALPAVVRRQAWPVRPGSYFRPEVRKIAELEADRNAAMWSKVETDPAYREVLRDTWTKILTGPPSPRFDTPEKLARAIEAATAQAVAAVAKLRARGVEVVFVRPPSDGPWYEAESKIAPRPLWDALLARTGAPGIHFEDHAAMQGLELPEWSHLSRADAVRYTEALAPLVHAAFESQRAQPRAAAAPQP